MMGLNFFYAKHKHRMWKMHLKAFLLDLEDFEENRIVSSKDCRLGQWIQAVPADVAEEFNEWDRFLELHEKIHAIVKEIPDLKKKKKIDEAFQKIQELDENSNQLIGILDRFEEQFRDRESNEVPVDEKEENQ